jgi:hypothetical protein
MADHILKCWPDQFEAVRSGEKNFEFRKNDRRFQVGDFLHLRKFDPHTEAYLGKTETRQVTYMLSSGFGLPEGYVVMSLEPCPPPETRERVSETHEPTSGITVDSGDSR